VGRAREEGGAARGTAAARGRGGAETAWEGRRRARARQAQARGGEHCAVVRVTRSRSCLRARRPRTPRVVSLPALSLARAQLDDEEEQLLWIAVTARKRGSRTAWRDAGGTTDRRRFWSARPPRRLGELLAAGARVGADAALGLLLLVGVEGDEGDCRERREPGQRRRSSGVLRCDNARDGGGTHRR